MIHSMTAFAREQADAPRGRLTWELRSVNHRYLDLGLRLPEELRGLENAVREAVGARVSRGKVEAGLRLEAPAAPESLELDETVARQVLRTAARLKEIDKHLSPMTTAELLRWPGVLVTGAADPEALAASALDLLGRALDTFVATRAREGARLREFLLARVESAAQVAAGLRPLLPEVVETQRARLKARLAECLGTLDPARLEQEMVLFATRIDVSEELDRLHAHLAEIRRLLAEGGAIGRRLDFLMQELNREANTLGSKVADLRFTNASVELKVLIDQMREQIQNIE
jgi:uncharacterized protein (TIGR00255 family)